MKFVNLRASLQEESVSGTEDRDVRLMSPEYEVPGSGEGMASSSTSVSPTVEVGGDAGLVIRLCS